MTRRTREDLNILRAYDHLHLLLDKSHYGRLDRALLIALTGTILDHGVWHSVQSTKDPEKYYRVTENDCYCKDSRAPIVNSRKMCKHHLAVSMVIDARGPLRTTDEHPGLDLIDPVDQDISSISVYAGYTGKIGTYHADQPDRNDIVNLTKDSLWTITDLATQAIKHPGWRLRPFQGGPLGWVLERV